MKVVDIKASTLSKLTRFRVQSSETQPANKKMVSGDSSNQDRLQQLKAFDEFKAGVKGMVHAGITKIPQRPQADYTGEDQVSGKTIKTKFSIPVVDLADTAGRRAEMIDGVRRAAETVGFFQVVNHGIPKRVLDEMLEAARGFHELPREVKAKYYNRELMRKVKFGSNFDLYQSRFANWRDSLFCVMAPAPLDPQELPLVCRNITMEYPEQVHQLGVTLFELLSEALGLQPDHLLRLDCAKGHLILSHYYPPCPEPELTLGTSKHSDPDFLTILLQDHIGGLQVLYQNQWIDVPPVPGALVINIGDLLQLISNDRFRSVEHQVLANLEGPRVSISCFFTLHLYPLTRLYGPINELLTEDHPPVYRETSLRDFIAYYDGKGLDGKSALTHFKCQMLELEQTHTYHELNIRTRRIKDTRVLPRFTQDRLCPVSLIFVLEKEFSAYNNTHQTILFIGNTRVKP